MSALKNPSTWKVPVLFAAAALLAVTGVLLLAVDPGRTAPRADRPAPSAPPAEPSTPEAEPTRPSAPAAQDTTAPDEELSASQAVPPKAAETARSFVTAWASHDARPGRDASFSDAGRRAAAYATDGFADRLRDPGDRSIRLWQQWVTDKTHVTCAIDRVATPDGAPAATAARAYVRVLYTCTTHSAGQQPARSHEQIALELHHVPTGAWRVGALVNA
ncbi:hypothetical protein OG413_44830 [Streptomyces sp. NBC_01433]|uniref:hypothetical protein n=1 Tax=Streptomyces sp. NBC_01433 TaxID=2903864 RepID=UPI002259DD38|nr:hypothetical protein [Streptomyces sp. NBC_01433]MCX4682311.1 hypothetical protein [Streptomyces sp. NBC_01433]